MFAFQADHRNRIMIYTSDCWDGKGALLPKKVTEKVNKAEKRSLWDKG